MLRCSMSFLEGGHTVVNFIEIEVSIVNVICYFDCLFLSNTCSLKLALIVRNYILCLCSTLSNYLAIFFSLFPPADSANSLTMIVSVAAVLCCLTLSSAVHPKFEFVEEWHLWKSRHEKVYDSHLVELERHITWLSNKKYIEQHNKNAHIFGFELAMNQFGDMVRVVMIL